VVAVSSAVVLMLIESLPAVVSTPNPPLEMAPLKAGMGREACCRD
jgi:hypothetical protein